MSIVSFTVDQQTLTHNPAYVEGMLLTIEVSAHILWFLYSPQIWGKKGEYITHHIKKYNLKIVLTMKMLQWDWHIINNYMIGSDLSLLSVIFSYWPLRS